MGIVNDPLEEAKEVLNDLERYLEKDKAIWEELRELNPEWEQLSEQNWQEKQARMWLHGATEVHECNELERWLYDCPPLSATAQSSAQSHNDAWREWLENV